MNTYYVCKNNESIINIESDFLFFCEEDLAKTYNGDYLIIEDSDITIDILKNSEIYSPSHYLLYNENDQIILHVEKTEKFNKVSFWSNLWRNTSTHDVKVINTYEYYSLSKNHIDIDYIKSSFTIKNYNNEKIMVKGNDNNKKVETVINLLKNKGDNFLKRTLIITSSDNISKYSEILPSVNVNILEDWCNVKFLSDMIDMGMLSCVVLDDPFESVEQRNLFLSLTTQLIITSSYEDTDNIFNKTFITDYTLDDIKYINNLCGAIVSLQQLHNILHQSTTDNRLLVIQRKKLMLYDFEQEEENIDTPDKNTYFTQIFNSLRKQNVRNTKTINLIFPMTLGEYRSTYPHLQVDISRPLVIDLDDLTGDSDIVNAITSYQQNIFDELDIEQIREAYKKYKKEHNHKYTNKVVDQLLLMWEVPNKHHELTRRYPQLNLGGLYMNGINCVTGIGTVYGGLTKIDTDKYKVNYST